MDLEAAWLLERLTTEMKTLSDRMHRDHARRGGLQRAATMLRTGAPVAAVRVYLELKYLGGGLARRVPARRGRATADDP